MDHQIVLEMTRRGSATDEDYHHKDALKWGFKQVPGETSPDYPYLYTENDILYANATSSITPPPPSTNVPTFHNPIPQHISPGISVRASLLPPPAVEYSIDRQRVAVDLHDMTTVGDYTVKMTLANGQVFELHVDTGSPLTWLCAFYRGSGRVIYDASHTRIPHGKFQVKYVDGSEISGRVCKDTLQFKSGNFEVEYAFGAAEYPNERMIKSRTTDGLLALSFVRPSRGVYFTATADSKTFLEVLMQEGKILEPTFCIKIRQHTHGTLIFGRLPTLSDGRQFHFQPVVGGRWALPSPTISVVKNERCESHKLTARESRGNAALFDTGTNLIYLDGRAVVWLFNRLFEEGGYIRGADAFFVTEKGASTSRNSRAAIRFDFGEIRIDLPAKMVIGGYDIRTRAFYSNIQAKGAGTDIDDPDWSFDLYGAAFFKWAWFAFNGDSRDASIGILVNMGDDG